MSNEVSVVYWLFGIVQAIGLTSACVARLSQGSRRQTSCQRAFFGSLAVVGGAGIFSLDLGPGCWLVSGTTLSLMVLIAVWDFGQSRQAALP